MEKWMEDVITSMQGSQRAKPKPALLAKINNQFNSQIAIINFWHHWRYTSIAAAFVLFINSTALIYYTIHKAKTQNVTSLDAYKNTLISSYQIY
ncbi:hypothetical protein [Maribacter sp. IgM3_T14_3]|uniref:hypothetical protein n=1 Tax=Maribacter sp. IgM3_T14_3 TaxID=3415140 RepID=UPI003C6EC618